MDATSLRTHSPSISSGEVGAPQTTPRSSVGERRMTVVDNLEERQDQLQQVSQGTTDKARGWRARRWGQEKAELTAGVTAGGVGFTKFLNGSANAFKLGMETGAKVGTALGGVGVGFAAVDVGVAVVAYRKASKFGSVWGQTSSTGDHGRAQDLQGKLKEYRGKDASKIQDAPPDVRFALDPKGVDGQGRSHLSKLSPQQQKDQLTRIARYAEAKCDRKMARKTLEGTLSTVAMGFGVAALATAAFPPLSAALGAVSLAFGIARGVCTIAKWVNGLAKRASGTLGQAREQNAKALYELATNRDSDPGVRAQARETLTKLGVDMAKVPDPDKPPESEGPKSSHRDDVVLSIMLAMKS